MASRVFHLSGLQLDQATSGAYYSLIVWGTGLVRNTGEQPISGVKTFYDSAFFRSGVNIGGDLTISGDVIGSLNPKTDNLYDVGSITKEWRNAYFDGTGSFDTLVVDENLTVATGLSVGGNETIGGNSTISGNLNLTGNFTITGDFLPKNIARDLSPKTNNLYDLGSLANQFKNAYFDGVVQTDGLIVDESATVANNFSVGGNGIVSGNLSGQNNLGIANDATIGRLFITGTGVPATTGSAGSRGQIAIGNGYIYNCTGTNAWVRVAMAAW